MYTVFVAFVLSQPAATVHSYADGQHRAIQQKQPHIVFIGTKAHGVEGCVASHAKALEGYEGPCIVVATLSEGSLWFAAQLPALASDADIRAAAGLDVNDALAEVNAVRAKRGLRLYIHDAGLTIAAQKCAKIRADGRIAGHINDFAMLPPGVSASATGCGALTPDWGWGTCCTTENWTYAGAACVIGNDGKRYMHLFCR
jgi:hypothetical protein